jgi:hypothetical protein
VVVVSAPLKIPDAKIPEAMTLRAERTLGGKAEALAPREAECFSSLGLARVAGTYDP